MTEKSKLPYPVDSDWGRCLSEFLDHYERRGSSTTLSHYRSILSMFFSDPGKIPDKYTRADVEAFTTYPDLHLTASTRNERLSSLRMLYLFASRYMVQDTATGQVHPIFQGESPTKGMKHVPRTPKPQSTEPSPKMPFSESSDWGRCLASFLRQAFERSGSIRTLERYTYTLNLFFTSIQKEPQNATRAEVDAFIHAPGKALGRVGKPLAAGTRSARLSAIASFYSYAQSYTIEGEHGEPVPLMNRIPPTAGIKHPRPERGPIKFLTEEEVGRFFDQIPLTTRLGIRDRAIFTVFLYSARRLNEVIQLKWGALRKETIVEPDGSRRVATIYSFYGKGHQRQIDHAELAQPAVDAIEWMLIATGRMDTIKPDDPIFQSDRCDKPISAQLVWYRCKKFAVAAGIDPKRVSAHTWRHTSARFRLESGQTLQQVQHALRHSSIATTDIYIRQLVTPADPGAAGLAARFGNL